MTLDEIDKEIINALFEDGRSSLMQISEYLQESINVSMSHTGIRKRINKLKDEGVLGIQGNINFNALNLKAAFILMEMRNFEQVKNIIECYSTCPRVFLLAQITGQYNLILGFVAQNMENMHRYLNRCGPNNKEGILHSAVIFVSNIDVPNYLPLTVYKRQSGEQNCGNVCASCEAFMEGTCPGCGLF